MHTADPLIQGGFMRESAGIICRGLLAAVLLTAAGWVALAGPAGAQAYGGCQATASSTNVSPGQTITVSGSGAQNNGTVVATIGGTQVGSGTADANGNFNFSASIPQSASGTVAMSVDCGGGAVASITLTVAVPATTTTTTTATLSRTGAAHTASLTAVAVVMLAAGGLALLLSRRRVKARGTDL